MNLGTAQVMNACIKCGCPVPAPFRAHVDNLGGCPEPARAALRLRFISCLGHFEGEPGCPRCEAGSE